MYDIMVARATPCQSGVNWVTKHAVRNTNPIFFRFQIKFKGFNSNAWSPYDHTVRASSKHRNSTGAQITQLFPSDWAYYNFRRKNLVDKLHIRCAVKFILFLVDLAISYSQSYNWCSVTARDLRNKKSLSCHFCCHCLCYFVILCKSSTWPILMLVIGNQKGDLQF